VKTTLLKYLGLILTVMGGIVAPAQSKRAIVPSDCVTVRYLADGGPHKAIEINPQGTRVAYLVKAPNISTNENEFELYIKDLSETNAGSGHLVASGTELSQLHWLPDGRHITILRRVQSTVAVVMIDAEAGTQQVIAQSNSDIKEYSIDNNADAVVYAIDSSPGSSPVAQPAINAATGYRISSQRSFVSDYPREMCLSYDDGSRENGSAPRRSSSIRPSVVAPFRDCHTFQRQV